MKLESSNPALRNKEILFCFKKKKKEKKRKLTSDTVLVTKVKILFKFN